MIDKSISRHALDSVGTLLAPLSSIANTSFISSPKIDWYQVQAPTKESEFIKRSIDALGLLEEDWDGYGAASISPTAIKNAKNFLGELPNQPYVVPGANGTVGLEWELNTGSAFLEIGETRVSLYVKHKHGTAALYDDQTARTPTRAIGALISTLLHGVSKAELMTRVDFDGAIA